jgi:hypothetical protein
MKFGEVWMTINLTNDDAVSKKTGSVELRMYSSNRNAVDHVLSQEVSMVRLDGWHDIIDEIEEVLDGKRDQA